MKKISLTVAAVLTLGVTVFLLAAASQPEDYRVERAMLTTATVTEVYAVMSDLHRFREWSPWEQLDPMMQRSVTGPQAGVGSVYRWYGNEQVGAGSMTIVATSPDESVDIALEFFRPFPATSRVRWAVTPDPLGAKISWTMEGKNKGLVARAFALFVDMDAVLGKDFERGLTGLKAIAEASNRSAAQ